MKSIFLIFLSLFVFWSTGYTQTKRDTIVYQTLCLNKLHPNYIIDGLKFYYSDSMLVKQLEKCAQIKTYNYIRPVRAKYKYNDFGEEGVLISNTDYVYKIDTVVLKSKKEKASYFSNLSSSNILKITNIEKNEAVKLYGKAAKYGVIVIQKK